MKILRKNYAMLRDLVAKALAQCRPKSTSVLYSILVHTKANSLLRLAVLYPKAQIDLFPKEKKKLCKVTIKKVFFYQKRQKICTQCAQIDDKDALTA